MWWRRSTSFFCILPHESESGRSTSALKLDARRARRLPSSFHPTIEERLGRVVGFKARLFTAHLLSAPKLTFAVLPSQPPFPFPTFFVPLFLTQLLSPGVLTLPLFPFWKRLRSLISVDIRRGPRSNFGELHLSLSSSTVYDTTTRPTLTFSDAECRPSTAPQRLTARPRTAFTAPRRQLVGTGLPRALSCQPASPPSPFTDVTIAVHSTQTSAQRH